MFIHRESEKCKFDEMCSKKLCSYKHSKNNLTSSSSQKEKDFSSKTSEPVKEYKFECEYCTFKSDSYMDFLDHINNNHLESEEERDDDNDDLDKNTNLIYVSTFGTHVILFISGLPVILFLYYDLELEINYYYYYYIQFKQDKLT